MNQFAVIFLKSVAAASFLVGVFFQTVVIPTTAADEVAAFPPYEPLRLPLVVAAITFVACLQAGLVALWAMLGRVPAGRFFDSATLVWARTVTVAAAVATVVVAGVFALVTVTDVPDRTDGMDMIGLWLATAAGTVAGVCVVLLLVLGQRLLATGIAARGELAEVI